MKVLSRILDAVDDRLNPIVVKELRQAVQSRFVIVMLLGFLLVNVLVVMFGVIAQNPSGDSQAGREIFMVLQAILLAACVGFLPIYSAIRLSSEHGDGNTDLLFITTVRAKLDLSVALNGWLQTQKSIHSTLSKQTLTEKPILIKQ